MKYKAKWSCLKTERLQAVQEFLDVANERVQVSAMEPGEACDKAVARLKVKI